MLLLRMVLVTLLGCMLISNSFAGETREIAITIDDLPFVGSGTSTPAHLKRTQERFMAIVNALVDHQVPATGFVIGEAVAKNEWDLLQTFRNQGFALGNHTYTHQSLGAISAEKYINDIERADVRLAPVLTEPKYFRYPYLAEGKGAKRQKVLNYLAAHQYIVAPVTIDSKDYKFNARFSHLPYKQRVQLLPQLKKRYLNYIWGQTQAAERRSANTKQILLLHANLLNSLCLHDILQMYEEKGYKFISLGEALKVSSPGTTVLHKKMRAKKIAKKDSDTVLNYNIENILGSEWQILSQIHNFPDLMTNEKRWNNAS